MAQIINEWLEIIRFRFFPSYNAVGGVYAEFYFGSDNLRFAKRFIGQLDFFQLMQLVMAKMASISAYINMVFFMIPMFNFKKLIHHNNAVLRGKLPYQFSS